MSEIFAISAVDRREETARVYRTVHSSVANSRPTDLTASGDMQNDAGGKGRRRPHQPPQPEDEIRGKSSGGHSFDVTV